MEDDNKIYWKCKHVFN